MKDQLVDIVKHTYSLGIFNAVKIIGEDHQTKLEAEAEDKSVIIRAEFSDKVSEFTGTFGMPSLGSLNVLLNLDEYKEDSKISVVTNNKTIPSGLHFENATGSFENDYRFMSTALVNEKIKSLSFNEPTFEVEIEPTVISTQRLKQQSLANSDEELFTAVVNDGDLIFNFGDMSTNSGKFVFATDQGNKLTRAWAYPVSQVLGILSLAGDKKMSFSNAGALVIDVDSGLIKYTYILPAHAK